MKVAILGHCGIGWSGAEIGIIIQDILNLREAWASIPNLLYTFDNLVEPTPYVGSYQSRNERSVIWAAAQSNFVEGDISCCAGNLDA